MYPARATLAAIATIKARHNKQMRQWDKYNAVMQALKNQLIATVDGAYLQGVKYPVTEYHNVTVLQMLEHLYENYGKINKDQKAKNIERMKEPYDYAHSAHSGMYQLCQCDTKSIVCRTNIRFNVCHLTT